MTAKASEAPFFERLSSYLATADPLRPAAREIWRSAVNEFATALKDRRYGELLERLRN